MRNSLKALLWSALVAAPCVHAQWAVYHDPTIPRTRDGKPNLTAPAPRLNGKPDLSGIWTAESGSLKEVGQYLLPEGINGLGETIPSKYFFSFFADLPPGAEPFTAEAKAQAAKATGPPAPQTLCPLPSIPFNQVLPIPFKILQTPRVTTQLFEEDNVFRQIFTDGRTLPADPQPSWLGYSVGKWVGDKLVVETIGVNDKAMLDVLGHPHSSAAKFTETFHRRDFGHLDMEITIDDPKTYTKPATIRLTQVLVPDTELLESFCHEDEKDLVHMPK